MRFLQTIYWLKSKLSFKKNKKANSKDDQQIINKPDDNYPLW
jgi:hypothetical protein